MGLTASNENLIHDLRQIFNKNQIKSDDIYLEVYGRDSSYFNLIPQVVIRPESADEVIQLLHLLPKHNEHITFRAGGTSLSGQAVGNGIICDLRTAWKDYEVRENGNKIWFEPGLTCAQINRILKKHGHKLGPDPASHVAAMMGGVLANNSSGMQAGTRYNSYRMITTMEFILANGNRYDSAKAEDRKRFETTERELCYGLMEIRTKICSTPELYNKINEKYKIKNVTGYGMNSFIDFDNPMDIFTHLLIGSEGTLAFIVSAEQQTLPLYNFYSSSMLYFKDVTLAAAAVPAIASTPALSVEMMDYASLKSMIGNPSALPELNTLPEQATALLVDYGANSGNELDDIINSNSELIQKQQGLFLMDPFTQTLESREKLWKIRDGIFPCVAGARALGDTVILEDVVAPVNHLYDLVNGLQGLFAKYGYKGSIFGHARDGNLHPLVTSDMQQKSHIEKFGDFMEEFVECVLSLNGSLKGEHGTGRAIAPFVEKEWGSEIYGLMKQIKKLADPENRLNPDVIITTNPKEHLENIKPMTPFGETVNYPKADSCIECGFCEHVCPSRYATLTPRQRIQARRIIAANNNTTLAEKLEKEYTYEGQETCAADGMCREVCPMQINTADLTDQLRTLTIDKSMGSMLKYAAHNFKQAENIMKNSLDIAVTFEQLISPKPLEWSLSIAHKWSHQIPKWNTAYPKPPHFRPSMPENPEFIYFPACVSRIFGPGKEEKDSLMDVVLQLANKAHLIMALPDDAQGLCCSQIWQHKGSEEGAEFMANKVIEQFWIWSAGGHIPIVCDTTSCTHTLIKHMVETDGKSVLTPRHVDLYRRLKIIDITEWLSEYVLPRVTIKQKKHKVLLHPTCACQQMGLTSMMQKVAEACAEEIVIPDNWGCCGASGDRSFSFPELGESATRDERNEIKEISFDGYYSLARTCEINLEENTGYPFESIAYLLKDAIE